MKRRNFLKSVPVASLGLGLGSTLVSGQLSTNYGQIEINEKYSPLAITMWDFSWLERRWPGAGYEDWDKVLNELKERGYNAVRIDAYPHLVAENPAKEWTLLERWNQQDWGSPDIIKVKVQPALNQFIAKCKERGIKVALSTWHRQDMDKTMVKITTAVKHGEIWIKTLQTIERDGLLDNILYVDLGNEWRGDIWQRYFPTDAPKWRGRWYNEESMEWMKTAIGVIKKEFPKLPLNFSFDNHDVEKYMEEDLSFFDLADHHIWMVHENNSEFYKEVEYNYERFDPIGYKNVVARAEPLYQSKPDYWNKLLTNKIDLIAACTEKAGLPLVTTECWGIVNYKDWPMLSWEWVKDLCELGTVKAASTGQWVAIATSNFCGPQFVGMWRDIEWHQKLTEKIKSAPIDSKLHNTLIVNRMKK